MRDDPANHAGRYRLCADMLGPGLEQVNVMRGTSTCTQSLRQSPARAQVRDGRP